MGNNVNSSSDVENLLIKAVGDAETLHKHVKVVKEQNKPTALITLNTKFIPNLVWRQIQHKVKDLGGRWSKKQQLWEVPLK